MANPTFLRRVALKTLALRPGNPCALLRRPLSGAAHDPPFSRKPLDRTPKPRKGKARKEPPKASRGDPERPVETDLPFDFRYSYSETNAAVEPIGFREPPRFSPFGPGRIDRTWTGTSAPAGEALDPEKAAGERGRVLGASLSEEEIAELVERYRHSDCNRQINMGKCVFSVPAV